MFKAPGQCVLTLLMRFSSVCPPSFEELEKRLRARGTETEEQVQKRLRNARAELEEGKSSGLFDHILINDNLDTRYESLKVYATSMAMLLTMVLSVYLFNFKPTLQLFLGIIICMVSLHMYFAPPHMLVDVPATVKVLPESVNDVSVDRPNS